MAPDSVLQNNAARGLADEPTTWDLKTIPETDLYVQASNPFPLISKLVMDGVFAHRCGPEILVKPTRVSLNHWVWKFLPEIQLQPPDGHALHAPQDF